MTTAVLAFLIMLTIIAGMAIGVMFGRKPITGSCGGMKALGLDVSCEICGGNPDLCDAGRDSRSPGQSRGDTERTGSSLYYPADD